MTAGNRNLDRLKNLGPVSRRWLNEIGIFTISDLERAGSVEAYLKLKRYYPKRVSLNLLYGMEAALMGIHWKQLPQEVKAKLKSETKLR